MSAPPPVALPPSLSSVQIPHLSSAYYIPSFLHPHEESALLQKVLSAPQPTWRHLSHRRLQAHPSPLTSQNILLDVAGKGLPDWLIEPVISRLRSIPTVEPPTTPSDGKNIEDAKEGEEDVTEDQAAKKRRMRTDIFAPSPHTSPNHVLINEYAPGQGIHPHEDGDAYFPLVCTVSLGSHTVLDVRRKGQGGEPHSHHGRGGGWRILQEPRSLLITTGEMYTDCLHGIAGVEVDEGLNEQGIANWALLGDRGEYAEGWKRRGTRISLTYRDVVMVKKVGKAFEGLMR